MDAPEIRFLSVCDFCLENWNQLQSNSSLSQQSHNSGRTSEAVHAEHECCPLFLRVSSWHPGELAWSDCAATQSILVTRQPNTKARNREHRDVLMPQKSFHKAPRGAFPPSKNCSVVPMRWTIPLYSGQLLRVLSTIWIYRIYWQNCKMLIKLCALANLCREN